MFASPKVYFEGNGFLKTALDLAGCEYTSVDSADVLIVSGNVNNTDEIGAAIRKGKSALIFLDAVMNSATMQALCGVSITGTSTNEATSISFTGASGIPAWFFEKSIDWKSAPQVWERFHFREDGFISILQSYDNKNGDVILALLKYGRGRVYILNAFIDGKQNREFSDWPYYNYLIYALVSDLAGTKPLAFYQYRHSPIPHFPANVSIVVFMLVLVLASVIGYRVIRRYSKQHPELLDKYIIHHDRFEEKEEKTVWSQAGFHRPLSGFLLSMTFGLIIFIPFTIYNALILPVFILPSPQAMGMWGRVTQFFGVFWLFFDWGTSTAFVKFMSEYQKSDPKKGVQFGQLFVWWQLITGMMQATIFIALACFVMPKTALAIYSFSVITHTMIQVPGFYSLTKCSLQGVQRYDFSQTLDILQNLVLPIILQSIIVLPMYIAGRNNPSWGSSLTGLIGMGVAAYAQALLSFLIGAWLYKKLGYGLKVFFFAHFDKDVIKTALKFGAFEMLGSIAWAVGQALEILITQSKLINYNEIWANWGLAWSFVNSFGVLLFLYNNVMPSISEAYSKGKYKLCAYYEAQSYKWGGIIAGFLGGMLMAVAPKFILGASGPYYARAAKYIIPLTIFGLSQFASWIGDNVALGANKPYLKPIMVVSEQIIRLGGAWLFIEKMQVNALILFYIVGLIAKGVVFYFINNTLCFKHKFYTWQTVIASLLAGLVQYAMMLVVGLVVWKQDQLSSILYLLIGILPSLIPYAFVYSFFGGWDTGTLEELKLSAQNAGFMKWFAMLFYYCSLAGAKVSPLHNRFPISIRAEALKEAASV